MKMTPPLIKRAGLTGSTVALAALASFALAPTTLAKKGGGGKPDNGDGGNNPPEVGPLPVVSDTGIGYTVAVLDGVDDADPAAPWAGRGEVKILLEDINKHGVACGEVHAPEESGQRTYFAIIATADGGLVSLDAHFAEALQEEPFAGLHINGAWEINAAGQVACDLSGDESGNVYVAVGDLATQPPSLTLVNIVANSVYGYPGGGPVADLNEDGDLITYEGAWVGKRNRQEFQRSIWLNTADGNGGWNERIALGDVGLPRINNAPLQLAYVAGDSTLRRWDSDGDEELVIDDFSSLDGSYGLALRITDDGGVYYLKTVETRQDRLGYPVRWTQTGGLQALAGLQDPSTGPMPTILDASKGRAGSEAIEVLVGPTVSTTFEMQIYHSDDTVGTLYPIEVTGADTSGTFSYRPTAISRPDDASGHGHICGWANVSFDEKNAFILTPLVP